MRHVKTGLAALGVGGLLVLGPGIGVAQAGTDLCISINGDAKVQMGTATCSSVASGQGKPNRAFAKAANAEAIAGVDEGDSGNTATATGENSHAEALVGDNNTATASGDDTWADAGFGDNNTATASGDDTWANAGFGDDNTATASGDSPQLQPQVRGV